MPDGGRPLPAPDRPRELDRLLAFQLVDVETAIVGVRRDLDAMVHDARVALRKLRVSLSLFRDLLDPGTTKPLRVELSWLAGILGPTRDAQVMVARLGVSVAETCPDHPLAGRLLRVFDLRYDEAAALAQASLAGPRVTGLSRALAVAAQSPPVTGAVDADARLPELVRASSARLLADLREAPQESAGAVHDEHLHELRKTVKRVRYVRQAAAAARDEHTNDDVHAALMSLQALLGEHQDSVVMRQQLAAAAAADAVLSDVASILTLREERAASYSERRLEKVARRFERALREPTEGAGTSYT